MSGHNLSAADVLIGRRIVPRTKQQYQSKIRSIVRYYNDHLSCEFSVPVERDHILAFFGWLIEDKHKDEPLAISSVKGYKSALKWWYEEHRLIIDPAVNQELDTLLKGYQRKVSELKLEGKMPVFQGKYRLTFDGYRTLASLLFTSSDVNQMLFAWPFLILQWNLIARSATISSMMMQHVACRLGRRRIACFLTKTQRRSGRCEVLCTSRLCQSIQPCYLPRVSIGRSYVRSLTQARPHLHWPC